MAFNIKAYHLFVCVIGFMELGVYRGEQHGTCKARPDTALLYNKSLFWKMEICRLFNQGVTLLSPPPPLPPPLLLLFSFPCLLLL